MLYHLFQCLILQHVCPAPSTVCSNTFRSILAIGRWTQEKRICNHLLVLIMRYSANGDSFAKRIYIWLKNLKHKIDNILAGNTTPKYYISPFKYTLTIFYHIFILLKLIKSQHSLLTWIRANLSTMPPHIPHICTEAPCMACVIHIANTFVSIENVLFWNTKKWPQTYSCMTIHMVSRVTIRPVSQMRATLGGLSRTSEKLWQDYLNCYIIWT